jgi:hypothetical protein
VLASSTKDSSVLLLLQKTSDLEDTTSFSERKTIGWVTAYDLSENLKMQAFV